MVTQDIAQRAGTFCRNELQLFVLVLLRFPPQGIEDENGRGDGGDGGGCEPSASDMNLFIHNKCGTDQQLVLHLFSVLYCQAVNGTRRPLDEFCSVSHLA